MERIIEGCNLILSADALTMKILRKYCVSHVNTIERNSKSIKDPDPLSSMMSNISMKYPITVHNSGITKYKIPQEYLMPAADLRKHGRTPCTLSLIQWYLDQDLNIPEEIQEVIRGLCQPGLDKLEKIMSMEWKKLSFSVGKTQFSRMMVATNPLDMRIPKELKIPLLSQVLGIENYIEYKKVPEEMVTFVKDKLLNKNNIPFRSLPNIIQFLDSALNERYRFLPIIPGMNEDFLLVSHVLLQPTFNANEVGDFISKDHRENTTITQVCINLIYHGSHYNWKDVQDAANEITVGGIEFKNYLRGTYENKYVRFVKGFLGMPTNSLIEYSNTQFHPILSRLYSVRKSNIMGTSFIIYEGQEKVNFSHKGVKGYFVHNGTTIMEAHLNKCNLSMIETILPHLAVFCCMNFENTVGRTYLSVQNEARNFWSENIDQLLGVSKVEYRKFQIEYRPGDVDYSIGWLIITDGVDWQETHYSNLVFRDNILYTQQNQAVMTKPKVTSFAPWNETIKIGNFNMLPYHTPKVTLKYLLRFFQADYTNVRKRILEQNWYSDVRTISQRLPERRRKMVANFARSMCIKYATGPNANAMKAIVFYAFTAGGDNAKQTQLRNTTFGPYKIYFNLSEGDLIYNMTDNSNDSIVLDGSRLISERASKTPIESMTVGVSRDLEIVPIRNLIQGLPHKPYVWLISNSHLMKEGEQFTTNLSGQNYKVMKNSHFASAMSQTIDRCELRSEDSEARKMVFEWVQNNKKRSIGSVVDATETDRKRRKYEDSSAS